MRFSSLLLGASALLCCALVFEPAVAQTNLVTNPGFESGVPQLGLPSSYGYWSFEPVGFVSAENGITPYGGSRMLHFLYTGPIPHTNTIACETYQIIDISGLSDITNTNIILSAWFNRVAGDSQTDNCFCVNIYAFAGSPSSFPSQINSNSYLGTSAACIYADADPGSWEQASATMAVPEGTDFLGIRICAHENVFNDGSDPEFDGHYADDVVLQIQYIGVEESSWGAIKSLFGR